MTGRCSHTTHKASITNKGQEGLSGDWLDIYNLLLTMPVVKNENVFVFTLG
jgi:hypothetical protein